MCDPATLAVAGIAAAGYTGYGAYIKKQRKYSDEAKNKVKEIEAESEERIAKQKAQFQDNGDVVTTNTQPTQRQQLVSLRLNQPKTDTATTKNLGLNI